MSVGSWVGVGAGDDVALSVGDGGTVGDAAVRDGVADALCISVAAMVGLTTVGARLSGDGEAASVGDGATDGDCSTVAVDVGSGLASIDALAGMVAVGAAGTVTGCDDGVGEDDGSGVGACAIGA